jgi:hypothetical protein
MIPKLPDDRLNEKIEQQRYYPYIESEDKEFPNVKWFVYGLIDTEELLIAVANTTKIFYEVVRSPVYFPKMIDRVWGIDIDDNQVAIEISDKLWKEHKEELIETV